MVYDMNRLIFILYTPLLCLKIFKHRPFLAKLDYETRMLSMRACKSAVSS